MQSKNLIIKKKKEAVYLAEAKHCNYCGSKLDEFDLQEDFTIHKTIGYGSTHDGERVHLQLCCTCFDRILDACVVSPTITEDVPLVGEMDWDGRL